MKHGDKAKGKASKDSKTSGKKVSQAVAKGKASESKGSEAKAGSSKVAKSATKAPAQAEAIGKGGSAKGVPARASNGDGGFGNAIIAGAFKRAAKKYNNAFRRLTD